MSWLLSPPVPPVFRRRENDGEPVNDRRLRREIDEGRIVRIAVGAFASRAEWEALTPLQRHSQQVWEASARLQPGAVFSHHAAAALHGIDRIGPWPALIDVSIDSASGGRSSGSIRRHPRRLDAADLLPWGSGYVTTPLRTTLDLVMASKHLDGVVAADRALWLRRKGGPLIDRTELLEAAHSLSGRGAARAPRAAEFAVAESDSVRETQSRVLIAVMGFPPPELQTEFRLSNGSRARTDFSWLDRRHIGEFDGVGKYRDPALLQGRTPEQALLAEKDREDDLRRQVDAFSRWRTPDLIRPRRMYDILTAAGLPSSRPRPGY